MNRREHAILSRLIPLPKEVRFNDGREYQLCNQCKVTINSFEEISGADKYFRSYWNISPELNIKTEKSLMSMERDGYSVHVSENLVEISARSQTGIMHAMKTLRQLAEPARGTERVNTYILPQCEINDAPAMPFRGIHICIFPETPMWEVERMLRLAAYHKVNYAVIETWGVFPFESHPEFCWQDRKFDKTELKRLILLGEELGVTLFPQFNLLGHATASRVITGKHAVLDFEPSLQPIFEPCGWSWCLSNPETRRILTDLVMELYDFFERPPYFHIGCDEAYDVGSCAECSKHELKELIREHILYFHGLFKAHGTRVIMWHDMLVNSADERWKGYVACGGPELDMLYQELPRDIIIADWQYYYAIKDGEPPPEWPTAKFFKNENFEVLVCPWKDEKGAVSLGDLAETENLTGMLETTWHIFHNTDMISTFSTAPAAAWSPAQEKRHDFGRGRWLSTALHLRQIQWDMKINEYTKFGFVQNQVDPGHHPHKLN